MADTTELVIQDNGQDITVEITRLSDGWDVAGDKVEVCKPTYYSTFNAYFKISLYIDITIHALTVLSVHSLHLLLCFIIFLFISDYAFRKCVA